MVRSLDTIHIRNQKKTRPSKNFLSFTQSQPCNLLFLFELRSPVKPIWSDSKKSAQFYTKVDSLIWMFLFLHLCTGKSFSETLILALSNPQYNKRLSMELPWKIQEQNMFCPCSALAVFMAIPWTIFCHIVA